MYFEKFHVNFNPFLDYVFKKPRDARNSRHKKLQNNLGTRKESFVALTKREIIKVALIWDENTSLQAEFSKGGHCY